VPLIATVLAGNVVTAAMVAACLSSIDAAALRRLHPTIAAAVAAVPWGDTTTPVRDIARWRAALPAAVGCKLRNHLLSPSSEREEIEDADIARLPPTLRSLDVSHCQGLTQGVSLTCFEALVSLNCSCTAVEAACLPPSLRELRMKYNNRQMSTDFSHLRALRVLDCIGIERMVSAATIASLPPSLEVLGIGGIIANTKWPLGGSLAHLTRLRVLSVAGTSIDAPAFATFPPSLHSLDFEACTLATSASFVHLHCLREVSGTNSNIGDAVLATLPPSLTSLILHSHSGVGGSLTSAAAFPRLPALRVLNLNGTGIGDEAVASMPPGLEELHMVNCRNVTLHASLHHLAALRVLHSSGADLSPDTLAACRARGCIAPADGDVAIAGVGHMPLLLIALPGGRLAGCLHAGHVMLWEAARRAPPLAEVHIQFPLSSVHALAALPDGHRVAIAASGHVVDSSGIVVWDTRDAPHVVTAATIAFVGSSAPMALAVLPNGHLVAGCSDGKLRIVDVNAHAVMAAATSRGHTMAVTALAVLPDGRLASGSHDRTVRVWDADARVCVATLAGHTDTITSLAALSDGRLASGSWDGTAQLWDVDKRVCVGALPERTGHLAVLPDCHRLVSLSHNDTLQVWDTRDAADGAPSLTLRQTVDLVGAGAGALVALRGGRLATAGWCAIRLWQLQVNDFGEAPLWV